MERRKLSPESSFSAGNQLRPGYVYRMGQGNFRCGSGILCRRRQLFQLCASCGYRDAYRTARPLRRTERGCLYAVSAQVVCRRTDGVEAQVSGTAGSETKRVYLSWGSQRQALSGGRYPGNPGGCKGFVQGPAMEGSAYARVCLSGPGRHGRICSDRRIVRYCPGRDESGSGTLCGSAYCRI